MSTNNLKEAVNHNTYNAPVTINNYYGCPVPPPEEPPVVPAKKKRGWVFETTSIGYWYHCFWRLRRPYIVVRFGSLGRKPEVVGSKLYELRVVGLPLAQY
ncbi:hypothetical protein [Enterobacter cloacae]|uniref:hypothetical protein n=1 Tax=Enterobacter cloacae TaxID=550 RepID=UPI00254A8199|nr:hypothetical protein [Enterobacter cloacae]